MTLYDNKSILQCGSSSRSIHIQPDGASTCSTDDNDCWDREYEMYIPTLICDMKKNNQNVGTVPLVFALHGYGGSSMSMIPWEKVAEEFGFILVRPQGYQRSWNAKYCCGEALAKTLNDFQFLRDTIDYLHDSLDFVHKDVVYGIGWSNGGYMVSYAAELFRGIIPISGYQYQLEDINFEKYYNKGNGSDGSDDDSFLYTGLFQHHSLNDPVVRYNGCCKDESCCCGINAGDLCVSAESNFHSWGKRINKCLKGEGGNPTIIDHRDSKKGITCHTTLNCHANTTLCVYDKEGHFRNFAHMFPMFEEGGHFISRDVCSLSQSAWSTSEKKCFCNDENVNLFCLYVSNEDRSLLKLRRPHLPDVTNSKPPEEALLSQSSTEEYYDDQKVVDAPLAREIMVLLGFMAVAMILLKYRRRIISKVSQKQAWKKIAKSENEVELSASTL